MRQHKDVRDFTNGYGHNVFPRIGPDLVVTHQNCPDGFCVSWLAWKMFGNVEIVMAKHGDPPPPVLGRRVLIADFSYPRAILEQMAEDAEILAVLDHHKTARADLEGLPYCAFDMERSGARMVWDFFNTCPPPWIVAYVEDRDLFRWALPASAAVNAAIFVTKREFSYWEGLLLGGEADARKNGMVVQQTWASQTGEILEYVEHRPVDGRWHVPVVNSSILRTELGTAMLDLHLDAPFSVVYWRERDGWVLSFRSEDRREDVSEVAKLFGGGGHRNAAGARVPVLPWER